MNLSEVNRLLAYVAAIDNRRIDDSTVLAWETTIGDLDLAECLEAARRHFASSRDWLMPAHIRDGVAVLRKETKRPEPHEVRALPSRFEDDDDRVARVKRGIAQCAEALSINRRGTPSRLEVVPGVPPPLPAPDAGPPPDADD